MENAKNEGRTAVEVVEFDAVSGAQKIHATCRLAADGTVSVVGSGPIAERLKTGIYSPVRGGKVTPAEGRDFLDAVMTEFKNIRLFARDAE